MVKCHTWELSKLPPRKRPVGRRWVYTVKYKAYDTLEKYKARLVEKGYNQSQGIDYFDTFASVAKFNTMRTLIALAAKLGWNIHQYDAWTAFLHEELEEEEYMTIPSGYKVTDCNDMVCRMKKTLYRLKQSPRMWFGKLTRFMHGMNYTHSNDDHTMFFQFNPEGKQMILIVYVDDIISIGDDDEGIKKLGQNLSKLLRLEIWGNWDIFWD